MEHPSHGKGVEGVVRRNPANGKVTIQGRVTGLGPQPQTIHWLAAAPVTRGIGFAGSGAPYPNRDIAFENTPHKGVIESTDGTIIGTGANAQYISYLLGGGAFAVGTVAGVNDLEIERTAATGNGAGHTALWTRRDMLIHPQGFNFIATDKQLTGGTEREALSASWTDLQNKDYWTLGGNAEQTSIRILVTNL